MKISKVSAFTIMEMVVVMLLSSIVFSITFKSYDIIAKSFLSFQEKQTRLNTSATIDMLLKKDFIHCQAIKREENLLHFFSSKHNITYVFNEDYIIRKMLHFNDTFYFPNLNFQSFYLSNEIKDNEVLIDEISFIHKNGPEETMFRYYKSYGADKLIIADSITLQQNKF